VGAECLSTDGASETVGWLIWFWYEEVGTKRVHIERPMEVVEKRRAV